MACSSKIFKHTGTGRGIAGLLCLLLLVAGAGLAAFLSQRSREDTSALHAVAESPNPQNATTMIPTVTKSQEPIVSRSELPMDATTLVSTIPKSPEPGVTKSDERTDATTTVLPVSNKPAVRCHQLDTSEACIANEACRWKEKKYKCEIDYTKTIQPVN